MKRKLMALLLTVALCAGLLILPAGAAVTAYDAVEKFEAFNLPAQQGAGALKGRFYVDFDQDGVPEMGAVYSDSDYLAEVYFYWIDGSGAVAACSCGGDRAFTYSSGMMGGNSVDLVFFKDGRYGIYNDEWYLRMDGGWEKTYRYNGSGAFTEVSERGEGVFYISDSRFPGTYDYFAKPTAPVRVPMAYPSDIMVDVDGTPVLLHMYALKDANGNLTNYAKVRDVAMILNGSAAQFNVGWDGAVNLTAGEAYVPNGSEMEAPFSGEQPYTTPTAATKVNGQPAALDAIVLTDSSGGGYTYYKLRDLGAALGFVADWSHERGVYVDTVPGGQSGTEDAGDLYDVQGIQVRIRLPEEAKALLTVESNQYGLSFRYTKDMEIWGGYVVSVMHFASLKAMQDDWDTNQYVCDVPGNGVIGIYEPQDVQFDGDIPGHWEEYNYLMQTVVPAVKALEVVG